MRVLSILRRRWKMIVVIAVIALPIAGLLYLLFKPSQPQYITAEARRGDLLQTVEAVGTVVSDRDLALQFPVSGVAAQVLVREGDTVRAGQRLAVLRNGSQAAAVAAAAAYLQSEEAGLRLMQEGTRPEDIAIAEAELQNRRASLQVAMSTLQNAERDLRNAEQKLVVLKSEASVSLAGDVSSAGSTITQRLTTVQTSLNVIDDVLDDTRVRDVMLRSGGSHEYDSIRIQKSSVDEAIRAAFRASAGIEEYQVALSSMEVARSAAAQSADVVQRAYDYVSSLPVTSTFGTSDREMFKATLATQKGNIQSALSALDTALRSLRDGSATYATRIAAEESALSAATGARDRALADIQTFEAAVRTSEAQLQLKRAGSRQADIDAKAARVRQARADVARAQASLNDTILVAPVAGTVTQVFVKPGEFTPAGPAINMLGDSPYRVEMFVSEIDIPKVQLTQTGSVDLDAFPGQKFALTVSEVDPAATNVDGVSKYRVKLDFIALEGEMKIGMTGDAEIVTGISEDVVTVPRRAVLRDETGRTYVRVLASDGSIEERTVTVGMEGVGGEIVVDGVREGETVVVLVRE